MIIILLILFIGIILFPSISFNGAMAGLALWAVKLLPAIFPAMLITSCIMQSLSSSSRLAYIYIIGCGLFCGYPTGAFACANYHKSNQNEILTQKIIGYCNISGSVFVINYIYYNFLYAYIDLLRLLLIIYLPPVILLTSVIIRHLSSLKIHKITKNISVAKYKAPSNFSDILKNAVDTSVENSLKLGGYIVFFSCLSAYITYLFPKENIIGIILGGVIEITGGINLAASSPIHASFLIVLITAFNAFGGISTIMQTSSVIADSGLSIKKYIYQKLICTAVTVVISVLLIYVFV